MIAITLMVLFLIFVMPLLLLLIVAVDYVMKSVALSRIAKQTGACKPAHAWIPIVQYRVLGKCAEACHESTDKSGKKPWKWGKIMLIMGCVNLGAIIFVLPLALLLAFFGFGILVDAVAWVGAAFGVASAVCAFKIYRYYMDDPYDIIVLILTVMYSGWTTVALLITSFLKPRAKSGASCRPVPQQTAQQTAQQQAEQQAGVALDDGAAVIDAEEE